MLRILTFWQGPGIEPDAMQDHFEWRNFFGICSYFSWSSYLRTIRKFASISKTQNRQNQFHSLTTNRSSSTTFIQICDNCIITNMLKLLFLTFTALSIALSSKRMKPTSRRLLSSNALQLGRDHHLTHLYADNGDDYFANCNGDLFVYDIQVPEQIYRGYYRFDLIAFTVRYYDNNGLPSPFPSDRSIPLKFAQFPTPVPVGTTGAQDVAPVSASSVLPSSIPVEELAQHASKRKC